MGDRRELSTLCKGVKGVGIVRQKTSGSGNSKAICISLCFCRTLHSLLLHCSDQNARQKQRKGGFLLVVTKHFSPSWWCEGHSRVHGGKTVVRPPTHTHNMVSQEAERGQDCRVLLPVFLKHSTPKTTPLSWGQTLNHKPVRNNAVLNYGKLSSSNHDFYDLITVFYY